MFNDLPYIYSAILDERWKGKHFLSCGQQFLQYQENEQSQKKTKPISFSAVPFSGYTQSQKIVTQTIKRFGIKKIKMSSQWSKTLLRSPMSSQGSQTYLRLPMSNQCSQTWLRSPMSRQGSQTCLWSPMSSQGNQTWLRSPMSERGDH